MKLGSARFYGGWSTEAIPRRLVDALGRYVETLGLEGGVDERGREGAALDAAAAKSYEEVRVQHSWVEVSLTEEWRCALRLAVQGGAVVVTELRLFPLEEWRGRPRGTWSGEWLGLKASVPPQGVTARLLRQVTLGHVQHQVSEFIAWARRTYGRTPFEPERWLGGPLRIPRRPGRRRRPGPTDAFIVQVAARYAAALITDPRRPIPAAAAQLELSAREVSRLVFLARRRGLLPKTKQGRAGGSLTAKARRLLQLPAPLSRRRAR
jgi:hypothetical protein